MLSRGKGPIEPITRAADAHRFPIVHFSDVFCVWAFFAERRLGVARCTIQDNLKRAAAGLKLPLPDELSDDALERQLFGGAGFAPGQRRRIEPDWADYPKAGRDRTEFRGCNFDLRYKSLR